MEKKYILTNITKIIVGIDGKEHTLHRIQLVKSLLPRHISSSGRIIATPPYYDLPKGEFGGWVESENNLSQDGNCWIYGPAACVYGNAKVLDNAIIRGSSQISEDAVICVKSDVGDHSIIDTGTYKDVIVTRNSVYSFNANNIEPEISM